MLAHEFIAFEELVDGEVGLHAWDVVERLDAVVGQRHHALVGGVVGALQADHFGTPGRERPPAVEGGQFGLRRFDEFNGSDPPAQVRCRRPAGSSPDPVLAPQDRRYSCELVGRQRIQWVVHPITQSHQPSPRRKFGPAVSPD